MADYILQVTSGQSYGMSAPLSGGYVTIGRDPASELCVDDPYASRFHARLADNGQQVILTDLNSTNGTMVNGRRIANAVIRPATLSAWGVPKSCSPRGRLLSAPPASDTRSIPHRRRRRSDRCNRRRSGQCRLRRSGQCNRRRNDQCSRRRSGQCRATRSRNPRQRRRRAVQGNRRRRVERGETTTRRRDRHRLLRRTGAACSRRF